MGPSGDIMFQYQNPAQNLSQKFSFSLKQYFGLTQKKDKQQSNAQLSHDQELQQDYLSQEEGITSFKLDLNSTTPSMYSQIQDENVEF